MSSPVREVPLPTSARALTTLPRLDYTDTFFVETDAVNDLTPEQWARAALEDAPEHTRRALRFGWTVLGARLGSTRDPRRILGWEVRHSSEEYALLGGMSILGFDAELLFTREPKGFLFATLMTHNTLLARLLWARIEAGHRRVVRSLLRQALARRQAPAYDGPARSRT